MSVKEAGCLFSGPGIISFSAAEVFNQIFSLEAILNAFTPDENLVDTVTSLKEDGQVVNG